MAKNTKPTLRTTWYDNDKPLEEHEPAAQIAHQIVVKARYLSPSVDRIMTSELTEPQRELAIELFQASLGSPDDPHRNPKRAIETALATTS